MFLHLLESLTYRDQGDEEVDELPSDSTAAESGAHLIIPYRHSLIESVFGHVDKAWR